MLFKPGNFYEIIRWLGLAILTLILVFYIEAMCALYVPGWDSVTWLVSIINVFKSITGLTIIILLFALINSATQNRVNNSETAFPSTATVWVGLWLFLFAIVSILGVYFSINPKYFGIVDGEINNEQVQESLIVLFAAGMGSSITTMLGYLSHASEKKDFDLAFVPWYFARPLMGMLLGLIFYFALKGGILVLTVDTASEGTNDFNNMALAAVGALVGMFSKNAIEKLREVFNILFSTNQNGTATPLPAAPTNPAPVVAPNLPGNPPVNTPVSPSTPATDNTPVTDTPPANAPEEEAP